jgi:hypothetical protein
VRGLKQGKRRSSKISSPEKSKSIVSGERAKARKKKKLQDKISDDVAKTTEVESIKFIKERSRLLKEKKAGAKIAAETMPEAESISREIKDTISLKGSGLPETYVGDVEKYMMILLEIL